MFRKLVNLVLSRLPIFKQLNGYKTEIGFALYVLSWVAQGLSGAGEFFPAVEFLSNAESAVAQLLESLAKTLEQVGLGFVVVGVGHDKIKRKD